MQIKVIVNNRTRVVRSKYISYHTENDLYCTYKNHSVCISRQDCNEEFYVTVKNEAGSYAVDGCYGGPYCRYSVNTIEDCLAICIENILL